MGQPVVQVIRNEHHDEDAWDEDAGLTEVVVVLQFDRVRELRLGRRRRSLALQL
jgi:hypothetical protein